MKSQLPLSIIIVNHNSGRMTLSCLDSIKRHAGHIPHEVIVVDNGSQDGSADLIEKHHESAALLRMSGNLGFGAANNRAAAKALGRYLLLINNDALLLDNTLNPLMASLAEDSNIGVAAPEIRYPNGRFQLSCGPDHTLLSELIMKHFSFCYGRRIRKGPQKQIVDWVSGACMLIPTELFRRVGGFDETFFLYMEDADLCKRIRDLGHSIILDRRSTILHHLGTTASRIRNSLLPAIKRGHLYYYARHNSRLSLLILKGYLYLRFRWDKSLPPEIHAPLMEIIRNAAP